MAEANNKAVTVDLLKTAITKTKQEGENYTDTKIAEINGMSYATAEEVEEMLNEVFGGETTGTQNEMTP